MNELDEPELERDDKTPTIADQAKLMGWEAGMFNFGARDNEPGVDLLNPGLIKRKDGLWLLVRRSENQHGLFFGKNSIWACQLRDRKPFGGPMLQFPESDSAQQFEDPRVIEWGNKTWVSACNFTWFSHGNWTGAHQVVGVFESDEQWTPIARKDPPVGNNRDVAGHTFGKHEKNWLFFVHENRLHLLYNSKPWRVIEFGQTWEEQKQHVGEAITTTHGDIRGGTPPVLVDGLYWTFYHSSVPWRGRYRRYFMGAIAFEASPPFKPVRITPEPLLSGSQQDFWRQQKPLVIFPCGCIYENESFYITYGINDLKCGYVDIPMADIMRLTRPFESPTQSLIMDQSAAPVTETEVDQITQKEGDEPCAQVSTPVFQTSPTSASNAAQDVPAGSAAKLPTREWTPEQRAEFGARMAALRARKKLHPAPA